MKKLWLSTGMLFIFLTGLRNQVSAQDPIAIVIKEAVKKVIVAVDLKIQRLQTKTIGLQHAQKVVENEMSKLKLDAITDWVQKQKDLYQNYFDELWQVKNALAYYHRVKELMRQQVALVNEYKRAWAHVRQDKHFSTREVLYIGQVYTGIMAESLRNLDQLALVVQSFTTQMSDAGRLQLMNHTADAMQKNHDDLHAFTTQNVQLSLARSRDLHDIVSIKSLYGIQ